MRRPGRAVRGVAIIAGSLALLAAAAARYLNPDLQPHTSARAGATPEQWNGVCPPTELKLTGAYLECASIDQGLSCAPGFEQAKVVRLHGLRHEFLLYVEINGVYRGPRTYALRPWPRPTLGVADGTAKVAIREAGSGRLFESSAGSLSVDNREDGGFVFAGLVEDPVHHGGFGAPVKLDLNIAGWWSCS